MLDYDLQRCSRRCAKTDRELKPGEVIYTALEVRGAELVRQDFCEEAWEGPPPEVLAWWKSQLPDASSRRVQWAPNDAILQYFTELESQPGQEDVRYLLALLMIRRRILRLEDTEPDPQGGEVLVLYCARNETEYRTRVALPPPERQAAIQTELQRMLTAE